MTGHGDRAPTGRAEERRPQIAVVVATCDRGALLEGRSLPSVAAQTRRPDYLLVVDDSNPRNRPANRAIVGATVQRGTQVIYLENARTAGASGSWNTALHVLLRRVPDPSALFVAILDDDDAWSPGYLEQCIALVEDADLTMVAAGILRFESSGVAPVENPAPESLRADDFLVGNPGIQGSNLFVRLDELFAAGCFDEALTSTTDRDLCIRLSDVGSVRYGRLSALLVEHHAGRGRPQLSTRGSPAKLGGLTAFWQKHGGRMDDGQGHAFCRRAAELFGWRPPEPATLADAHRRVPSLLTVVLGIVVDDQQTAVLDELIRMVEDGMDDRLVGLDVVLLDGSVSGTRPNGEALATAARRLRGGGVGCFCVDQRQLDDDARHRGWDASSSTVLREVMEFRVRCVAGRRPGTQMWLVDHRGGGERPPGRRIPGATVRDIPAFLRSLGARHMPANGSPSAEDGSGPLAAGSIRRWLREQRTTTAESRVAQRHGAAGLRLLGRGSEAVVFTDEQTVFKCIDYWKTRMPRSQLDFLAGQVGRWTGVPGLYPLKSVTIDGPWALLTYDYEPSVAYRGGREEDLLRLLASCRQVGIVCNNICPKNLVVTDTGVKLIDYGSDIRPFSRLGFEHMARRAFLTCHHAGRADLASLLRRALVDARLPEMAGYPHFRARAERRHDLPPAAVPASTRAIEAAPMTEPWRLHVGVISGDPAMLAPLMDGLLALQAASFIERMTVVVLQNGDTDVCFGALVDGLRERGLPVALVSEEQQRRDAGGGAFGRGIDDRPPGRLGIARARTMLQRYVGALMASEPGAFGWLLDDDMRVDERALGYLPWLPAFRRKGTAVLIGQYEGASPNPPLNGIRVQLLDILHNLLWLKRLDPSAQLPDRSPENQARRARSPDYYYDLSRKHTDHLEMPHWLEPVHKGETVAEALARLSAEAVGLLTGRPLTRPLVVEMPRDPLGAARDSVNRGGCTFILDHRALTDTPNTIIRLAGREARRSDMIWAIVNRYARGLEVKAVAFPIGHLGRVSDVPAFDAHKVHAEIVGSAIYAALMGFLKARPTHRLDFSAEDVVLIADRVDFHTARRLDALASSFHRIRGLTRAIRRTVSPGEFELLLSTLEEWFAPDALSAIRDGVAARRRADVEDFLASLRSVADDFAQAEVDIQPVMTQLVPRGSTHTTRGVIMPTLENWCSLPTPMGDFRMYDTGDEAVRVVCIGDLHDQGARPLLRIHSSCLASEVFGALDCDCADQLREAMKLIAHEGRGLVVHLQQEGRGQGLSPKIRAVRLMQADRLDTFEAFEALGLEQDVRTYPGALTLLDALGIRSVRLISNNPAKMRALRQHGIEVEMVNTHPAVRPENEDYLRTKRARLDHRLRLDVGAESDGPVRFYHSDQSWGDLSNFSRHAIFIRGRVWPTVEHFYQAQKFAGTAHGEQIRRSPTPIWAKRKANDLSPTHRRSDWAAVKVDVMLDALRAKFTQHPELRERLLSTGERRLVEHTTKDAYWGDGGDGRGLNRLGEALMRVRSELGRSSRADVDPAGD